MNSSNRDKNNFYYITFKYTIGDVVMLLNGKIRKIQRVRLFACEEYTTTEYQGRGYTPFFSEQDVACLLSSKKQNELIK